MNKKYIFNPYLQLHSDSADTDFLLFAPKPSEGYKTLRINYLNQPDLYSKISDISGLGLNLLDIENDLTDKEINIFLHHGILIDRDQTIEKPLFSCQLKDVNTDFENFETSNLIINPDIRFEPFNLANFKIWINEKHLSPHQPIIWVKNRITDIESGYWLDPEETLFITNLLNNGSIDEDIDIKLLQRLYSAQILTTEDHLLEEQNRWTSVIKKAKKQFREEKYALIENILPEFQINALQRFYKQYVAQGFMEFGDEQVNNRYRQHNEPLARFIHHNFAKLMSLVAETKISPSYCYAASYKDSAELKPHRDREQCKYSISFQVDYEPIPKNKVSPWSINIAEPFEVNNQNISMSWSEFKNYSDQIKKTKSMNVKCGDGIFYKGQELIHYREKLPKDHTSTSLFFHFVDYDFKGNLS